MIKNAKYKTIQNGKRRCCLFKPKFDYRYVDDTYNRRNKNEPKKLFEWMNKYNPNIILTVEVNPSKFLDTRK